MKRTGLFLMLLGLSCSAAWAQDRIPVEIQKNRVYINLLQPSILYEAGLNDRLSLALGTGITFIYGENDYGAINPFLNASLRNYYPRKRVKKELDMNSGNYVAAMAGYTFGAISEWNEELDPQNMSNSGYIGGIWGIQRNYMSGIHLGLSLGGGVSMGKNIDNVMFAPLGGFEFGFVIK